MGVPLYRSSPKKLNSEQCLCQISVSVVSTILRKIKKGFPKMINDAWQSFHSHFSQNERVTRVTLDVEKYLSFVADFSCIFRYVSFIKIAKHLQF